MNPIRIAPSPSTSTPQADAAASGSSEAGSEFGPILLAASGQAAPAPARSAPQAQQAVGSRGSAPQGGGGDTDASEPAGPDRALAARSRHSAEPDSRNGSDPAAAAAAACMAAHGTQARSEAVPAGGQSAAIATVDDATRATGAAIDAASASATPGIAAAAIAAASGTAAASGPASAVATAAAADDAARPIAAAPIGARTPAQAVALRAADAQASQPAGSAPAFAVRASAGGPVALLTSDVSTQTEAADGADPSAGFSAALPGSVLAAGRDGLQAIAQAAAAALAAPASKPIEGAAARAGIGVGAMATSDAAGAPTASAPGAIAPAPIYTTDGRSSVATPVGHPEFGQELSQRVVLLARGGVQTAQISLQPPDLGPVGVSIQVHGHAATLAFTAAHEATRNALEAALPRLREAFAASGLQLSDATVGGRSQSDWAASARPQGAARQDDDGAAAGAAPASEPAPAGVAAAVRLVDIYA